MDDPRVLRLVTVGLVLAALAVVYFLFTGGFSITKPKSIQTQTNKAVQSPGPGAAANPSALPSIVGQTRPTPTASSSSAYNTIANRNQAGIQTLPGTGFPAGMAVVFSLSAIVSGLSLRKFPR